MRAEPVEAQQGAHFDKLSAQCRASVRSAKHQCAVQKLSAHCKPQGAFRVASACNASGYPATPKPMMMPAATGYTYE